MGSADEHGSKDQSRCAMKSPGFRDLASAETVSNHVAIKGADQKGQMLPTLLIKHNEGFIGSRFLFQVFTYRTLISVSNVHFSANVY